MSNKLLLDEHPLVILPSLAKEIGLNEAIILQQIHYWLVIAEKAKDSSKFYEGRWWTFGTYVDWQEQFPWWSTDTVGRVVRKLEKDGLLLSRKPDAKDWNQRKWYTIEYGKLPQSRDAICHDGEPQDATILNRNPKTSSKTSPKKESTPDGVRPPTPYILNSERMERCFSEARGCPLPDWEHDPKGSNKRWRMPLNKILKACEGNVDAACYFITEITREFRHDNLTFTAPDQILESVTSRIIDRKARPVIYAEEH